MKAWIIAGVLLLVVWAMRPVPRQTGITPVALPRELAACLAVRFAEQRDNLPYQLKIWWQAAMRGEGFDLECGDRVYRIEITSQ